jgi:hypothetical protein
MYLIIMIAVMFFSTAAAGAPAILPEDIAPGDPPVESVPAPPVRGCFTDCLISANVNIKPLSKGDTMTLAGSVLIVDENGKPVPGAIVIMSWTLPDGSTFRDRAQTDSNGIAVVTTQAMEHGMYMLKVVRAAKTGYQFEGKLGERSSDFWM